MGKAPKGKGDDDYIGSAEYAYHLDAVLLGHYLKKRALSKGVSHVADKVIHVNQDADGFISEVCTEYSGPVAGDLFIDCSGFRGLLINEALGVPFESFSDVLMCDCAIALQRPHEEGMSVLPYTTATALQAGWVWDTPLVNRTGNGYVFSSHFIEPEAAEKEIREFLVVPDSTPSKFIKMRVGMTTDPWRANCVSIGLAGGFIEPLESTGIYLIEAGIDLLLQDFPSTRFEPKLSEQYNSSMRKLYEEIRDFIVLHYCLTARTDTPFWRANRDAVALPESLGEQIESWKRMWPTKGFRRGELFADSAYLCILAGMRCIPESPSPIVKFVPTRESELALTRVQDRALGLSKRLPEHDFCLSLLPARAKGSRLAASIRNFLSLFPNNLK